MKNLKFYVGNFSVIIFFVLQKTHRSLCIYWTKAAKMYTFKHMQATHDSCTTQQKCTKASKYIELLTEWEHKTQRVQICSSICWCVHVNLSLVSLCVVYASQSSSPGAVYLSIHSHADHRRLSRGGFMTKNSFPDTDLTSSCTEELLEFTITINGEKFRNRLGLSNCAEMFWSESHKTCEEHLQGTGL